MGGGACETFSTQVPRLWEGLPGHMSTITKKLASRNVLECNCAWAHYQGLPEDFCQERAIFISRGGKHSKNLNFYLFQGTFGGFPGGGGKFCILNKYFSREGFGPPLVICAHVTIGRHCTWSNCWFFNVYWIFFFYWWLRTNRFYLTMHWLFKMTLLVFIKFFDGNELQAIVVISSIYFSA